MSRNDHTDEAIQVAESSSNSRARARAQTGLPALAIALLLLTIVTGLGLAIADGALSSAERDAGERRIATSLAERVVESESPVTRRANVLNATRIDELNGSDLESSFPVVDGHRVRLEVNGSTAASIGDPIGGTTFRRLVVFENDHQRTMQPALRDERQVTIPRRTSVATLQITPSPNATVTTVRANDRIVLRNPGGLRGEFDVDLSRFETTRLRFGGTGTLSREDVTIRYRAPRTTKTMLVVTVDA